MEKTLPDVLLFQGIRKEEIQSVCTCLGARRKSFDRGELLLHAGEPAAYMGLVLRGGVNIEAHSYWGGSNLFGHVGPGEIFAEAYAVIPGREMLVDVVANEPTDVLFLPAARLLEPCAKACPFHTRLLQNLLQILARKNLHLSTRMMHTASRSIRARLLSYLSEQAVEHGSNRFAIQLADYLGVDRSALSKELSKMRQDGLLTYRKNQFALTDQALEADGKKAGEWQG